MNENVLNPLKLMKTRNAKYSRDGRFADFDNSTREEAVNSVNQWSPVILSDAADDKEDLMSGQKYKRTNFDDEDVASTGGTPPGVTYDPNIAFKAGANFWQRRMLSEKVLIVLSSVLTLIVIILSIVIGTHRHPDIVTSSPSTAAPTTPATSPATSAPTEINLCLTKPCVTVASSILNSMNMSVDPCEDFYEYACGGWMKAHPIPSGQSRWGTFSVMDKQNQIVIRNQLETGELTGEAEQKARDYYISCMDANKTIEALGARPLLDILRSLGGWSLAPTNADGWEVSQYDLQDMVERCHNLSMSQLFYMAVVEDEKDITHNILQIDQSGLGLARDQYLNKSIDDDKVLSAYLKYMTDLGVLLGGSPNQTRDNMRQVIEFEQQLAEITTPMEDRRDDEKLYHKMNITQLQNLAPFIHWKDYLNNQMSVTKYTIQSSEPILVFAPEYLTKLTGLLTETQQTDAGKEIIHNYMMWHVIKGMSGFLSKPFQDVRKEFMQVITGVSGEEEQWRYCTADTNGVMGFAVGALFVKNMFSGDSKDQAEKMITNIKTAFKNNLVNLEWMDNQTRIAAVEKANAVADMIGFPGYILNTTALDARYKDLQMNPSEYFDNNMRALKYTIKRNLDKLRKAPEKDSWSMTPATVNAYYSPTKNEIVFPAGILQAPFFDQEYPKSINYGGMGVVMGHELTHGFDDQGREYDKTGVLRPWWNNASIERFKTQAQCVVDKYSQYKLHDDNIRGKQTLGENIADNGGLKASYHAYEKWIDRHGAEKPLPGVNLTHRQLFFLSFSQVWCSNSKPESDHMGILTDPHSPSKFRVIGPLSNSQDFAQQFNCPVGSPMNPEHKCEVW